MNTFLIGLQKAFYFLTTGQTLDHLLILVLFGAAFQLKEWKNYLALLMAISLGSLIGYLLAVFSITHFSTSFIRLMMVISFLALGIHHLVSNTLSANAIRYNFFALIGLILGTGLSLHYSRAYGHSLNFYKLSGYFFGSTLGYLVLSGIAVIVSALFVGLFRTDRRSFNLALTGIGIGAALVLLYIRY